MAWNKVTEMRANHLWSLAEGHLWLRKSSLSLTVWERAPYWTMRFSWNDIRKNLLESLNLGWEEGGRNWLCLVLSGNRTVPRAVISPQRSLCFPHFGSLQPTRSGNTKWKISQVNNSYTLNKFTAINCYTRSILIIVVPNLLLWLADKWNFIRRLYI